MNRRDVLNIFTQLKHCAIISLKLRLYDVCLRYVRAASRWAYYFNVSFTDDSLEATTKSLSKRIRRKSVYESNDNRVVFYDSFAYANKGLTQQYLRALMEMRYSILFITDSGADSDISIGIYKELQKYENAGICNIPIELMGVKRAQYIYDLILDFNASKVFLHLTPYAAEVIMAMHALPETILRYQINLTDHAFWLGTRALDYSFEFRAKGMKASRDFRKIEESRLLLCPFYSIIEKKLFEGFPFVKRKDDVLLFSGGSGYKFINKEKTYAHVIKRILEENPKAIWVHAGDSAVVESMCASVLNESDLKRVFFIGERKDIAEVFNHIDIYVNSYPVGGGLMPLYAAHYKKPIIGLAGDETALDEVVGQLHPIKLASTNVEDLCQEAHRLIVDENYRRSRGQEIGESVIDEDCFNRNFKDLSTFHKNVIPYDLNVEVDLFSMDKKLEYENRTKDGSRAIISILRWRSCFVSKAFIISTIGWYMSKIKRKIKKLL